MNKLKIPIKTQLCFVDNLEPDENGCYPDWSRTYAGKIMYKFKHQNRWKVEGGETDGKTQRSCDTLVSEWAPNMKAQL